MIYLGHRNFQLHFRCNLKYEYSFTVNLTIDFRSSSLARPTRKAILFCTKPMQKIIFASFFGIARNLSQLTKNRMNDIYLINWVRGGICRQLFYIAAYKLFQPSIRYNVIYGIILYYMKTGAKILWQCKKPK